MFISINLLLTFFLYNFSDLSNEFRLTYGFIIAISIFGFTSLMDFHSWAPFFEVFRSMLTIIILYSFSDHALFINHPTEFLIITTYFILSSVISFVIIFNKNQSMIKFNNASS